ncbi:MAG: RHS repeat-associated core domain-containing protein, partial [Gammaproteobacteria bacterium]
ADATTLTFARDGSKNVRAEVNSSGSVTAAFRYRAYGQLAQSTAASPTYLGLASQLLDPSGLYYMRARWYDPVTGRLLARDPVNGDPAAPFTLNSYAYAAANPNRFSDPSGAFCIPCLALIPIAWQVIQVALTASDVVATAETLSDPDASAFDKASSVGLTALGLVDPIGGGYSTGARVARQLTKAEQVAENYKRGKAAENAFADAMRAEGYEIHQQVVKETDLGDRIIDLDVWRDGVNLGGIEVKTGGSAYTAAQEFKDMWLHEMKGYRVNVMRLE